MQARLRATALLMLLVIPAACAGRGADAGLAEGQVVLYTSMPQEIVAELEVIFEGAFADVSGRVWVASEGAAAPGLSLEVVRAKTGDLLDQIRRERAARVPGADVVWLADPAAMEQLKADVFLAPYEPPAAAPIPERYVDSDGYYVAARIINMVVAWNTDLIPEGLQDWTDLLINHRRRAFPGPGSGSALAAIKAVTDHYGSDYLIRYADSGGRPVDNNGVARDAIAGGDYQAAAVLDYMVRQARSQGFAVDFAYPAGGTVVIPSPIAVMAGARNPDGAAAFVDFVLSRSGQRALVDIGSFYPVRDDVAPPVGAPPLAEIEPLPIDWAELAVDAPRIHTMWQEVFG